MSETSLPGQESNTAAAEVAMPAAPVSRRRFAVPLLATTIVLALSAGAAAVVVRSGSSAKSAPRHPLFAKVAEGWTYVDTVETVYEPQPTARPESVDRTFTAMGLVREARRTFRRGSSELTLKMREFADVEGAVMEIGELRQTPNDGEHAAVTAVPSLGNAVRGSYRVDDGTDTESVLVHAGRRTTVVVITRYEESLSETLSALADQQAEIVLDLAQRDPAAPPRRRADPAELSALLCVPDGFVPAPDREVGELDIPGAADLLRQPKSELHSLDGLGFAGGLNKAFVPADPAAGDRELHLTVMRLRNADAAAEYRRWWLALFSPSTRPLDGIPEGHLAHADDGGRFAAEVAFAKGPHVYVIEAIQWDARVPDDEVRQLATKQFAGACSSGAA